MGVLFLFIDGVGLGESSDDNPVSNSSLEIFRWLGGGQLWTQQMREYRTKDLYVSGVDATLGVEGLPQSGTGQTALFTGKNAARRAGRHYGPFPHSRTKSWLERESLFHRVIEAGRTPYFMNAYPDLYFKKMEKRPRWTATTMMVRESGLRLNRLSDLKNGRALTAEIVQSYWRERLNAQIPDLSPDDAAARISEMSREHDLVLFEYYLTDKAGHRRDRQMAEKILETLNHFLEGVIRRMRRGDFLVLCSDHGNLEDLSSKTHTRNPVPFIVYGAGAGNMEAAHSITDVTPRLLQLMETV